jgi:ribose transport system substrate-binding protein
MFRDTLIAATAASCLLLTGCGPGKPAAKWVIALIPKGLTHQHWESVRRGGQRAAADLTAAGISVDVRWEGPNTEGDAREQIGIVNQMAGSGVNAIALAPQSSKAMIPCVREAVDRGIPVVVIDSGLDDESLYVKYVATNNRNGGRMAAKHLLKSLAAAGKKAPRIILLRYQAASESTEERERGFLDVVNEEAKKQKDAGAKDTITVISDSEYSGPTVESAQAAAGPLIEKFKDTADAIFAVNESATTGVLNVLRNKEMLGKITVMGFDQSKPLLQALRDGHLVGTIAQDPYRMGYLAVHAAVRHLEGDDVSGKDKYLPTGEYLITKDNVDSDETRSRIEEAAQAKRTIDAPKYPRRK